jgi:hypothetical protein
VSQANQREFAGKLKTYVGDLRGDAIPIFFHAAPSRENAEMVVAVSGWKAAADADAYVAVSAASSREYDSSDSLSTGSI